MINYSCSEVLKTQGENWRLKVLLLNLWPYKHKCSAEDSSRTDIAAEGVTLPGETNPCCLGRHGRACSPSALGCSTALKGSCIWSAVWSNPRSLLQRGGYGNLLWVPSLLWRSDLNPSCLRLWRSHCPCPAAGLLTWWKLLATIRNGRWLLQGKDLLKHSHPGKPGVS